ncbi:Tol-Pal system protein TolB [Nitrosophilus kaiyonis]|uniref:Tol-Pal system protein TolB n=1 Tax=Nitrosophilus kaiyonis TaxID=2930200 RepID=UPI00248F65DA|nr:Tol-Pal system protein TolB [Nitrosophilus kaiyonis]
MKKIFLICILLVSYIFAKDLTLEVVKEVGKKPLISVEDSSPAFSDRLNKKFFKLLVADLKVTSHFNVDEKYNYSNFDSSFDFSKYKNNNLVVRYELNYDDYANLIAKVKLFNMKTDEIAYQKIYKIRGSKRYPFLAHKIVCDINDFIGAPSVDWMRRFVIFSKYTKPRNADIVVSDYTLTYQKTIIQGGLNVFPKWGDKDQKTFYYTAYEKKPTLYRVNLYTGKRAKVLSSEGMIVCSDVSKDGKKLLITMAPNFQPDIYVYNLLTKTLKRVTKYKGIDVNGNFIENDKRVVFVSDRLGYPNIFAKSIDGIGVERLVYHGKNNSSCSAYGNYIVYSSRESNNEFGKNIFNLYLISTKSDYIRRLTATGVNQFPRFSIDGESILFIKHLKNQSALGIIRLNYNKSYLYPLKVGKIQSIDW